MTIPFKSVRVGILGLGTVGQSFMKILTSEAPRLFDAFGLDIRVTAIGNRDIARKRSAWPLEGVRFTDDLESVVTAGDVDVVVELMGGLEPANALLTLAIESKKHVVTANKLLLARHGFPLLTLAARKGVSVGLEASVAGGIPILRALRESFVGDRLESVAGILNGTCNFILTEMERSGQGYQGILAEAQRLGYAEADPTADVGGGDAACKLTLLARMAFGQAVDLDAIPTEGITRLQSCDFVYAGKLGRTPRQLATCRKLPNGRLSLSVRTHMVASSSILAKVVGPFNAVLVRGAFGGDFVFHGRGAGGDPTATAVLADVIEIGRSGHRPMVPALGYSQFARFEPASLAELVSPFYLRFIVRDQPGIIASISKCLAEAEINIDAVFQAPYAEKDALPFVITLDEVPEDRLRRALVEIEKLTFHVEPPIALPMTA